jgi:HEAT repeat protein
LIEDIIPLVTDPSAKREERIQAIRDMGNAGYTLGADALIDLLRDRDREMRTAAAWALEAISGTVGGQEVAHWKSWWEGLPQDAEAIADQDLEVRLFRKES